MNKLQHFILDPINNRPFVFLLFLILFTIPGWTYCSIVLGDYCPPLRLIGWLLFMTAMPALIAWICCMITSNIIRFIIYCIAVILFTVNIFLILNFDTMISPWILLLIYETNSNETSEFFATYALSIASIITYIITLLIVLFILIQLIV